MAGTVRIINGGCRGGKTTMAGSAFYKANWEEALEKRIPGAGRVRLYMDRNLVELGFVVVAVTEKGHRVELHIDEDELTSWMKKLGDALEKEVNSAAVRSSNPANPDQEGSGRGRDGEDGHGADPSSGS